MIKPLVFEMSVGQIDAMSVASNDFGIDYEAAFEHVSRLKVVVLVTTGRTGSDFFQSLLDGHSQILQMAGHLDLHGFWKKALCKENLEDFLQEFVWFNDGDRSHIWEFNSRYKKIERWDQLGPGRNESFSVDIEKFKAHFRGLLHRRELNSRNFFLAAHAAYGLASGFDIFQARLLFYHLHQSEWLADICTDFDGFDVIATIRDPRNTLVSGMEHWRRHSAETYTAYFYSRMLARVFEETKEARRHSSQVRTLKLEDLHLRTDAVFRHFCELYGVDRQPSMMESTYHGKKWWGDALSVTFLDGFNPNIEAKKWGGKLFVWELLWLEYLLEPRLKHYGYSASVRLAGSVRAALAVLVIPLPTRYEWSIVSFRLKQASGLVRKLGVVRESFRGYLARLRLLFRFEGKRLRGTIVCPEYLGQPYIAPRS